MARAISPERWATCRAAYRRGEGSLRELARRFKLHPSTVMERAAAEGWREERTKVMAQALRKAGRRDAETLAETLRRHRIVASDVMAEVWQRLRNASEVNARDLLALAKAAQHAIQLERIAIGVEAGHPAPAAGEDAPELLFQVVMGNEEAGDRGAVLPSGGLPGRDDSEVH